MKPPFLANRRRHRCLAFRLLGLGVVCVVVTVSIFNNASSLVGVGRYLRESSGRTQLALYAKNDMDRGGGTLPSTITEYAKFEAKNDSSASKLDYCLSNRGTRGNWYYNPTMGQETFYVNGFRSSRWYRENKNNLTSAAYPGNMYAWNDSATSGEHRCRPISPLTKKSFCDAMGRLELRRILFVGDSLAGSQLNSLVSLLGYGACDFVPCRRSQAIARDSIECTLKSSGEFSVGVSFHRENLGANLHLTDTSGRDDAAREHRQQFGAEIPYCAGGDAGRPELNASGIYYCPWHDAYNSTQNRTLLILNQGAHFHSVGSFSRSMEQFIESFNTLAHRGDVVVFRSTVPGHADCFDSNTSISPSDMTHEKFIERYGTTKYDWNLFDEYNAIAKRSLKDIRDGIITHYLNVYNMTVLRADQHAAATDCLHYTLPGPVDFWNHLLFTNLADAGDEWSHA
mmetsp:Transcript_8397/g.18151  ORF Transcript_8397/g.18151 Transcript_8397/m.18151 type:complete len:455 (+) Transcript_8397:242-1606(+)|eukprot:CAMPEP_0172568922 /NCGR_PEP_ID=MMETSP1067-20121228/121573_1 /TAXON_ID=265564 ORGANISM="Thalassiosira punctigera, Strain Tpunct2005C2" /NCGR_SAMPLE_ID=MMETSP1067 /ASSEMBLY_ACC=CAM_ASM_000444 /LENGTH=454 /DNA_ID=CAMNT_0013360645 /DNA_START=150 /DNA_END=1514 /DNA_ORIENTATION=+